MFRQLWLRLKDARLRAVLSALGGCGGALGDLAADPSSAPSLLRPYRLALAAARTAASVPETGRALAAAEDLASGLEKVFSDMALLGAAPDAACREALARLQRACALAPGLLSRSGRAGASAELLAHSGSARKVLALASAAAASDPEGFPQNLKFSSIYSGLDSVFEALERCAGSLYLI